jgi:hypothetical protein
LNVAEALARQIRRVAILRGHYAALKFQPGVNVAPALLLIDAALERGCKAAGSNDIVAQIAAGQELEGFQE